MPHPPLIAISLLSACVLAYEVLLTRLFSIVLWHHFAYMIISAAMLGYGASGTALTLLRERLLIRQVDSMNPLVLSLSKYERTHGLRQAQAERDRNFNHAGSIAPHFGAIYVAAAAALALLMPTTFVLAQQVPFNPLELLWDATQPFKLLAVYLLMMLPFFFGGLGIGLVFARFGAQASRIYACDILGAGAGSLGVVAALFIVPPGRMLSALAAMALLAAGIATVELKARPRLLMPSFLVLALLAATTLPEISVQPSPYKDLSQALNIAGARIVEQRSSPLGLVTVVENARVPLRHAPGMSLNATSEPPPQLGVFIDGDGPSALTRFDGSLAPLAYLDQLTSALPYHLLQRPRVLVLGAGPGGDVLQALYHRSAVIDAVELDHNVTGLVKGRFRDYAGALYQQPGVQVYEAEARGFVSGSNRLYDLIQVALLDSFGTASAGLYGLSENYLYTVEAFRAYLKRLAPGGILAVTRWLTLPPRDALKLFGTAVTALEAVGAANPGTQIAMIRGWKTVTLLVKNGGFTANEIAAMRRFTRARSFDLAWYPGMHADEANRFNVLPQPFFFEGAVELLGPQQQDFIERYKFHIEPATDDRPHFFRFFKWKAAGEIFSLREQGGMALFDWSYPLLVATLAQAIAASALLILLPLALSRCRRTLPAAPAALYFLAIGFAFMFMEIAFIQKFVLFLSHPLYAVAVVLCAFLVFASAGSWLAGRMQGERWRPSRKVTFAVVSIGVIALFYLATLPTLFQWLIHLSDPAKIVISVALIAPLAMCMGVPFPTGMMRLAHVAPVAIPWAWAINGFASVVGAVLATLLAIHLGFAVVILLAVLIYAVACAALIRFA